MKVTVNPQLEFTRRLGIILALAAAAVCFMWFDFSSLIEISQYKYESSEKYQVPAEDSLLSEEDKILEDSLLLSEEDKRLIDRPEDDSTVFPGDNTFRVSGSEWRSFFATVIKCFESNRPVKGWEHRVDGFYEQGWGLYSLWFRPEEKPLSQISGDMKIDQSYFIYLEDTKQILEAYYSSIELPGFASSTSGYPAAFVYPYRPYALPLIAGGLLIYLLLP